MQPSIPTGSASNAVGNGPSDTPIACRPHVASTVTIVPKAIVSPCAKLENRNIP